MNSLGFDDRKILLTAQVFYAQKNRLENKSQTCKKMFFLARNMQGFLELGNNFKFFFAVSNEGFVKEAV